MSEMANEGIAEARLVEDATMADDGPIAHEQMADTVQSDSIDNNQTELDNIQCDINSLLENINLFMSADEGELGDNDTSDDDEIEEFVLTEGDGNPAINLENLLPFIETLARDLDKLNNLETMTNDVVERVKKITEQNLMETIRESEAMLT
ncbi:PREDICTED: uncharacterized protein LOC108564222 isoform X2 [Nicrophorus vespilloides]|uniref:Uncharacterized protein LOC108564222 isoform X2 n=1 Tax=Nicrophorus vespilloides TaxID=110193 RepID=A0ABM1MVS2_NICVS|nr:PREDICTED: uncharacterized protein LOC108564222 isoform X2 [Nicrophorus vespilloides]